MNTCVRCAAAVAVLLSIMSGPGFAAGTSLMYKYGGDFILRIPAEPAASRGWMQEAVVFVPDHIVICDLNVFVSIRHTAAFDLQLILKSPSGAEILLGNSDYVDGYYEGGDYLATTFDDEAEASIRDGMPPFVGSFRPLQALGGFDGRDAYGPWGLRVLDKYAGDEGCLEYFALIITGPPLDGAVGIPAPASVGLVFLGLSLVRLRMLRR